AMGRPPLERIIIETTGLADPLPILHALLGDRALAKSFRLGKVVTTVDAAHGLAQLVRHRESVRQVAVADILVITKGDLADPADIHALRDAVQKINPRALVRDSSSEAPATGAFFDAVGSPYAIGLSLDVDPGCLAQHGCADDHSHNHSQHAPTHDWNVTSW